MRRAALAGLKERAFRAMTAGTVRNFNRSAERQRAMAIWQRVVRVQMEIPGGARRVEIGIRAEEVYERTGKHSIMRKETIHEESRPLPTGSQGKQSASFEIPKGAPPSIGSYGGSFGSESVRLRWYIFADADMPNASDIHSKLDLTVE